MVLQFQKALVLGSAFIFTGKLPFLFIISVTNICTAFHGLGQLIHQHHHLQVPVHVVMVLQNVVTVVIAVVVIVVVVIVAVVMGKPLLLHS